jgi:hypothetical protein
MGYSGHDQFEESTEEVAPLTEEEKKERLNELREALAEKRQKQALLDKEEQKKNEVRGSLYHLFSSNPKYILLLLSLPHNFLTEHQKLTHPRKSE